MYVFDHHVGHMETPSVVQFGAQYTMDNDFLCIGFNLLSANTNLSSDFGANKFKELLISRQWCFSGFSNDEYAEPVEVFDIFFWIRFKRQCFVRMPAGYRRLLFLVSTIFFCPVLHLNKIHLVNIFQFFKFCRTFSLNPSNSVS